MSAAFRKIPATVITGFLGAGKTTLVRHLMENAAGRRIALVINEFGDLGVDREILAACGVSGCAEEDIVELANGCLCCTVADEFLPTMQALVNRPNPPDHIVIETSGLALPKPLVKAFQWPEIRSRVTVDGVVAVVDAPAAASGLFAPPETPAHDAPLNEVFADQLACADMVLVNKADLMDEPGLDALLAEVSAQARAGVKALPVTQGKVAPEVLLGLSAAAEDDLDARPSIHDAEGEHDHEDFDTFFVDLGTLTADDLDALEARLSRVVADHPVLRVKGFLNVEGKPMRHLVQAVGARLDRYYDRPWRDGEDRRSRLVVIGLHGFDQDAIAAHLRG